MDLLIVDDDKQVRDILEKTLSVEGYKCEIASNGIEALKIYKRKSIDCVLLDIGMPRMDGIAVAKEILKINSDASIVMISGFDDMSHIRSTMRMGVFDYILKPFDTQEVVSILDRVKERNHLLTLKRRYSEQLEVKVQEQRIKLEDTMFRTIRSLVKALEAKDPYQKGHSLEVSTITIKLTREIGYSENEIEVVCNAALVHDVGKVGIPDSILLKPGPLTENEYTIIKTHPELGADILRPSVSDDRIIKAVLYHHERYDGAGFPKGLKGDQIPGFARVISMADALSAMLSIRPYRNNLDKRVIINEIQENIGTQFDPELAKIAVRLLKEGKIEK
ncbi:response regulator [candidate division WOR-3 bacterium]|nr:response regulator [candidate division WOR-3 bacterium]MCK4525789.1 response regulator [candidate division WOR-3 bacterium]